MPPVLAISGKRLFGKDTLARLLCDQAAAAGRPLVRRAFADESKEAFVARLAEAGHSVDLERLSTDRAYKEEWRPRLTEFTEAELARDPQVFCKRVFEAPLPEGVWGFLISDLRLEVEVDCLRERGAFLARLHCSDEVRAELGWSHVPGVDDHRTETELDDRRDWDAELENPGDLAAFGARAEALLEQFFETIDSQGGGSAS